MKRVYVPRTREGTFRVVTSVYKVAESPRARDGDAQHGDDEGHDAKHEDQVFPEAGLQRRARLFAATSRLVRRQLVSMLL
jgi:hypothetical protein